MLLTVADDGIGFDPSADTNGFGLRGMRNRVEQVGGTLTVESGPKGTTVRVEVPPVIRVLLVDDHPVVRTGVRGMLAAEPDIEVVGEAGSGADAIARAAELKPDVVLMDLRMPDVDGVAATDRILAADGGIRVVVLTTYETDTDILRAVEAGAAGYLLKDASPAELEQGDPRGGARRDRAGAPGRRPTGAQRPPARGPRPRCRLGRSRCCGWSVGA